MHFSSFSTNPLSDHKTPTTYLLILLGATITEPFTDHCSQLRCLPQCNELSYHQRGPAHMLHRCVETAHKYERKTQCLYPSPTHLKDQEKICSLVIFFTGQPSFHKHLGRKRNLLTLICMHLCEHHK